MQRQKHDVRYVVFHIRKCRPDTFLVDGAWVQADTLRMSPTPYVPWFAFPGSL